MYLQKIEQGDVKTLIHLEEFCHDCHAASNKLSVPITHHVGFRERKRVFDTSIYVAFSGKMYNAVNLSRLII